ncbi:MAG: filamentous hemagglutinin, partial [Haliea sp.]
MQSLALANSAFATRNALAAIQAGQGVDFDGKSKQIITERNALGDATASRDANAADQVGGINLSISIGASKSSSTTTQLSDTARGSTLAAGGNVSITATGAGQDSDILVRGSDVTAGKNATLQANGDIALLAAENTVSLKGSNKSSSGSIGISVGTSGFGVTASGSAGKGKEAGDDVSYTNTHITAGNNPGNTVQIRSGADTTLRGAVVRADTVKADVGGDLRIESLQDTSSYASKQQNIGASVTLGAGAGGSFNASKTKVNSDFVSVTEQSGIKAGDGGFQVTVKNDTDLKGAVIASNQSAVEQGKNSFSTGGTLTTSDIQNQADYKASSASVGVGTGMVGKNLGISGVGIGVGSDKGSASSTTTAGISGIAGDTAVISTDKETGIQRIFDKEKVQEEIDAQVVITEAFGREATSAWGAYANNKLTDAVASGDEDAAACWGTQGACRAAGHAVVGGLTGGSDGVIGSTGASMTAP